MIKQTPSINFLAEQRRRILLAAKRGYFISFLSFSFLGVFGLLLLGLFSYQAFLSARLSGVRQEIGSVRQAVASLSELELEYYSLKKKTESTVEIVDSLSKHQKIMEVIFEILPEGIFVNGVVINDTGDLQFDATTSDVGKLNDFIAILENNLTDGRAIVQDAAINQVQIDDEGKYTFSTIIRLVVDGE